MVCNWPCEAAHCAAAGNLFEVIDRALSAFRVDVAERAVACARHDNTFGGALTLSQHLQETQDALMYANNGQWLSCIQELEHIGTGGGSAYSAKEEATPPDSLIEKMEEQLVEWKATTEDGVKEIFIPGRGTYILRARPQRTPKALRKKKPVKKQAKAKQSAGKPAK